MNLEETWSIGNVAESKHLQNLCIPRIANTFDHFAIVPDHFKYTTSNGIELLVNSDHMSNVDIQSKLHAVMNWITYANSEKERKNRVVKFEALLNKMNFGNISTSTLADISMNIFPGLSEDLR